MAKKSKFLLVSLSDAKSKKLAQVLSNNTSRKILDYLADKDDTEQNISKKLNVPISTIHYNLIQLVKGGLVESEEYHYSSRGKEVKHYKLANQFILIAPKSTFGLKEKLKGLLPAVGLLGGVSLAFQYFSTWSKVSGSVFAESMMATVPLGASAPMAASVAKSAPIVAERMTEQVVDTIADSAVSVFDDTAVDAIADSAGAIVEESIEADLVEKVVTQAFSSEPMVASSPQVWHEPMMEPSLLDIHNLGWIIFVTGVLVLCTYLIIDYLRQRRNN